MSRTYRKPKWPFYDIQNLEKYIEEEISKDYNRRKKYGFKWVDKPKEQYEAEYEEALKIYKVRLAEYNEIMDKHKNFIAQKVSEGKTSTMARLLSPYLYHPVLEYRPYFSVKKTYMVDFDLSYGEFVEENLVKDYSHLLKYGRDGVCSETGRRTGYKNKCKRDIRRSNKQKINKILKDPEAYEDMVFMGKKDGKDNVWDFW